MTDHHHSVYVILLDTRAGRRQGTWSDIPPAEVERRDRDQMHLRIGLAAILQTLRPPLRILGVEAGKSEKNRKSCPEQSAFHVLEQVAAYGTSGGR